MNKTGYVARSNVAERMPLLVDVFDAPDIGASVFREDTEIALCSAFVERGVALFIGGKRMDFSDISSGETRFAKQEAGRQVRERLFEALYVKRRAFGKFDDAKAKEAVYRIVDLLGDADFVKVGAATLEGAYIVRDIEMHERQRSRGEEGATRARDLPRQYEDAISVNVIGKDHVLIHQTTVCSDDVVDNLEFERRLVFELSRPRGVPRSEAEAITRLTAHVEAARINGKDSEGFDHALGLRAAAFWEWLRDLYARCFGKAGIAFEKRAFMADESRWNLTRPPSSVRKDGRIGEEGLGASALEVPRGHSNGVARSTFHMRPRGWVASDVEIMGAVDTVSPVEVSPQKEQRTLNEPGDGVRRDASWVAGNNGEASESGEPRRHDEPDAADQHQAIAFEPPFGATDDDAPVVPGTQRGQGVPADFAVATGEIAVMPSPGAIVDDVLAAGKEVPLPNDVKAPDGANSVTRARREGAGRERGTHYRTRYPVIEDPPEWPADPLPVKEGTSVAGTITEDLVEDEDDIIQMERIEDAAEPEFAEDFMTNHTSYDETDDRPFVAPRVKKG